MDAVITKTGLVALTISGLGYMIFPPIYEAGIWKFVVPIFGVVDLWIAYALWKQKPWLNTWLAPFGIGTLIVAVPFWGVIRILRVSCRCMLAVESAAIAAAVCLLVLSFRPGFRSRE